MEVASKCRAAADCGWAHAQAVAYLEQTSQALQRLPESVETLAQAIDVRFELRTSS